MLPVLVHLAGAASLSLLPPSLPFCLFLSLPCSTSVLSVLSVPACFFFSLSHHTHSFTVSQSRQLGEAAVCASALQLPQVKAAVLSDVVTPQGAEGTLAALISSSHPGAGHTFPSISKEASRRKGQAEDSSNPTNKSQLD